ncbi:MULTISPECIES: ROK family protein [Cobetia]|uniref:ROK family protein n=1 Tax=Cobetia crustatorum TaxID=553385 RepID=A0A558HM94_9GAMM|nr:MULTISPECIES: ROK family protein [Cobetia]TVU70171.1 ROK family protein [Cobetia crustatorum]
MTFAPRPQAGDLSFLKQLNRSAVLEALRQTPGLTRAEVAQGSKLTKVTVGAAVQALLNEGWLQEGDLQRRGGGRPGRALYLNETRHALVGVEIGVHELHVVTCTLRGTILEERHLALLQTTPEETLDRLAILVEEILETPEIKQRECLGLGLAVPGPTSPSQRRLSLAPNLGWRDVALLDMLRERLPHLGGIWLMDNEAKAAAFGEMYFRNAHHPTPGSLLYISAGSGIGSGLVEGRPLRVIRGVHGLAGEIGHTVLQPSGLYCHCGNRGCAETLVSGWSIRAALGISEESELDKAIARHPEQNRVATTLKHAGEALGMLLLNLHHTLNPAEIVIGGSLTRLGPALMEPALTMFEEHQNRLLPDASRIVPRVLDDSRIVAARGIAAEILSQALSDTPASPRSARVEN